MPYTIIPDSEEAEKFVAMRRDLESGKPVPQMWRGRKCYVEKGEDGIWRFAEG